MFVAKIMEANAVGSAELDLVVGDFTLKTPIHIVEDADCTIRVEEEGEGSDDEDGDGEEAEDEEDDSEASEHSKDDNSSESDTHARKRFVTDFKINREKLASASPFFKTFLKSKVFKDTGGDIIRVHDISASVINVILCAAHGLFKDVDEEDLNAATTTLFMRGVGQPRVATAILETMRLPADQVIDVVAKAKEYILDYGLIRGWLLLWNHNASEQEFDSSIIACVYRLSLPSLFAEWVKAGIDLATDPIYATVLEEYAYLEIREEIRDNMNRRRQEVLDEGIVPVMIKMEDAGRSQYYSDAVTEIFKQDPDGSIEIESIAQVIQLSHRLGEHVKNEELDAIIKNAEESETRKLEAVLRIIVRNHQDPTNSFCLECFKRSLAEGYTRKWHLWEDDLRKPWEKICPRKHAVATWKSSWTGTDDDRDTFLRWHRLFQEVGPRASQSHSYNSTAPRASHSPPSSPTSARPMRARPDLPDNSAPQPQTNNSARPRVWKRRNSNPFPPQPHVNTGDESLGMRYLRGI